MNISTKIWMLTFICVILPMTIWYYFNTFILGNCDPKFGCIGGFQFYIFTLSICAFLSSVSVVIAFLIFKKIKKPINNKSIYLTTSIIGLILSLLTSPVLQISNESIEGIVFVWLVFSFLTGIAAYFYVYSLN